LTGTGNITLSSKIEADSSQLIADSLPRFEVRGWRFEAEKQNSQTHSSEVAEIAGLQPLTSNLVYDFFLLWV
jgi:hypothetical protein